MWRNWLAHWTVDPGVAGSSPVDPAILEKATNEIASWCNGSTADSDSACWGSSPCEATIQFPEDMIRKLADLIEATSSRLGADVVRSIKRALKREDAESPAKAVLETILENVKLAQQRKTPLCQDTGTLTFWVDESLRRKVTEEKLKAAVRLATQEGFLRKNTLEAVSGKSFDDNTCEGAPVVHYCRNRSKEGKAMVTLLMKGGGSENMSRQYSLPDGELGAGRDWDGVRRCILDAVQKAQGYGCAPGILGVCVGGDRATGYETAKEQLLRGLDDKPTKLEAEILEQANGLGIGPMGLGGRTTLLGVKIAERPRVPASFFVTVAYMCWAARRGRLEM